MEKRKTKKGIRPVRETNKKINSRRKRETGVNRNIKKNGLKIKGKRTK